MDRRDFLKLAPKLGLAVAAAPFIPLGPEPQKPQPAVVKEVGHGKEFARIEDAAQWSSSLDEPPVQIFPGWGDEDKAFFLSRDGMYDIHLEAHREYLAKYADELRAAENQLICDVVVDPLTYVKHRPIDAGQWWLREPVEIAGVK